MVVRQVLLLMGIMAASWTPVSADEICPALLSRQSMPPLASPVFLDNATWRLHLAQMNERLAATNLSRVRLLFLGDSITEAWMPLIFSQFYGHRKALNLGVVGDDIRGMLWRLSRIALGGNLRPQLIVLLIGTNNLWPGVRPEDVAVGIAEVVRQIHLLTPQSRILVVGLLPRGADATDPMRQAAAQVNQLVARCADRATVFYANPGAMLVDGRGGLSDQIAYDYLHPTWIGYAILAAGLEPYIHQLLGE